VCYNKDTKEREVIQMKKTITITAIVVTAIICATAILVGFAAPIGNNEADHLYPKTAIVDRLEDNDIVVCVDCNENVWTFYGVEDWQEGDIVSLLMDDMGTATIYDDEIVKTYYSGTVKGLD
jgi:hypothetical protein